MEGLLRCRHVKREACGAHYGVSLFCWHDEGEIRDLVAEAGKLAGAVVRGVMTAPRGRLWAAGRTLAMMAAVGVYVRAARRCPCRPRTGKKVVVDGVSGRDSDLVRSGLFDLAVSNYHFDACRPRSVAPDFNVTNSCYRGNALGKCRNPCSRTRRYLVFSCLPTEAKHISVLARPTCSLKEPIPSVLAKLEHVLATTLVTLPGNGSAAPSHRRQHKA